MNRFTTFLLAGLFMPVFSLAENLFFEKKLCSFEARGGADTIPPAINCPPTDTVELAAGQCSKVVTFSVTAYDNLPGHTLAQNQGLPSGSAYPIGATLNRFTVTDAAGNTASCSFTVMVLHWKAQSLQCDDFRTVSLGPNCSDTLRAADILENMLIGCPSFYEVTIDRVAPYGNGPWLNPFLIPADVNKVYAYRVQDPQHNTTCWGQIQIKDQTPPKLTCPDLTVSCAVSNVSPEFWRDSLGLVGALPILQDNCSAAFQNVFKIDQTLPGSCDSTFFEKKIRTWSATDEHGNTATCRQTIAFPKLTLAQVNLPGGKVLSCMNPNDEPKFAGEPWVKIGNFKAGLLTYRSCNIGITPEDSYGNLCDGWVRNFRKWLLIDWCKGKDSTVLQVIDIQDKTPPAVVCPPDLTVLASPGACSAPVDLPDAVATDACGKIDALRAFWGASDSLDATLTALPGGDAVMNETQAALDTVPNLPVGTNVLRYRAFDACGNSAECSFRLHVWDSVPPTPVCKNLITIALGSNGQAKIPASEFNLSSSDACNQQLFFKARRTKGGSPCQANNKIHDEIIFCCPDAGDTLGVELRVFDVQPQAGPQALNYLPAQSAACTTQVVVTDAHGLGCKAPPNAAVKCTNFDPTLAAYDAGFEKTCTAASHSVFNFYGAFDTVCQRGRITRFWRVTDAAGATSECIQTIDVQYDTAAARAFFVKFPDDRVSSTCNDYQAGFGEPELQGAEACLGLKIDFQDQLFTVAPDACWRIERRWAIVNYCIADPAGQPTTVPNPTPNALPNHSTNLVGPVVSPSGTAAPWAPTQVALAPGSQTTDFSTYWNQNGNGYRYTQIIKIIDNEDPAVTYPPGSSTVVDLSSNDPMLWNESYWLDPFTGGHDLPDAPFELEMTTVDCVSKNDLVVYYLLFLDTNQDGTQETVVNSWNPGNGVVGFNNSGNPNYTGGTPQAFDNRAVASDQKYRFSIQKTVVNGAGVYRVAWNTLAQPNVFVPAQLPYGKHKIQWHFEDKCGNETLSTINFSVYDTLQVKFDVSGRIATEKNDGVNKVIAQLDFKTGLFAPQMASGQTDTTGQFLLSRILPLNSTYTLKPVRADNPLAGVTTFDLLLISKHILNVDTLDTPYRIIAADANFSNTVTTFDIVTIRKVILGIESNFPNGKSWRFVTKGHVFANPINPFSPAFPETISGVSGFNALTNLDFTGVKIGDTNGNVKPDSLLSADDRSGHEPLAFEVENRRFERGDTLTVFLKNSSPDAEAWQFTLEHKGLEISEILPGEKQEAASFAVFPSEKTLTAAMFGEAAEAGFGLRFRALERGSLAENLRLTERITPLESVFKNEKTGSVALRFREQGQLVEAAPQLEIFSADPNPFSSATTLRFSLPAAGEVRFAVFDPLGRLVFSKKKNCPAGAQAEQLDFGGASGSGVFICKIESDFGAASVRLVRE